MSLQKYQNIKDSGVDWLGVIPNSWDLKKIGNTFTQRQEKVSDKEFQALSVTKKGIVLQLDNAAKTNDGDNRKKVAAGDFVINSRSDRKGSSGLSAIDGSVSLISIVVKPNELSALYTHHLLRSYAFQEEFYRWGQGIVADLWSTNYQRMKNITIPIPSSSEQHKIAYFLEVETAKIDHLVAQQEKLLSLLEEKRRATITHAITRGLDPNAKLKATNIPWSDQVPAHWIVKRIKNISQIVLGKMVQNEPKVKEETLEPYLKSRNIQWSGLNLESIDEMWFKPKELIDYDLVDNDIIVSEGGEVGKCVIWKEEYGKIYFQNSVNRVRVGHGVDHRFVYFFFSHLARNKVFENTVNKVSIAHLTKDKLAAYKICMPPLKEQTMIADFLENEEGRFNNLVSKTKLQIALLKERRISLISHTVTGKIRV